MRCKNCKKKIENPDLFRCPHCGKKIERKKKVDTGSLALSIAFPVVTIAFVVISFFSFFFDCYYYSTPAMIISAVVVIIAVPFMFGNYKGMKSSTAEVMTAIVSIPFIVNWGIVFIGNSESLDRGGLYSAYYICVVASMAVCDALLILKAFGVIKSGKFVSWIALACGLFAAAFSVFFYVHIGAVKAFAIIVVVIQAFTPQYFAFHVMMKDEQSKKLL